MLLTKHISDISFRDVVEFCALGIPEGVLIDYKAQFPDEIEKHIAAMANTLGGLIIIGVEEDNERPKPPFDGHSFDESIRRTIENKVHANISPVPFIEVANCLDDNQQKSFLVIRIPQSISTPHVINKGRSIYVRTGQSSHPEDIASPDEIAWLYERRAKSKELKNALRKRSLARFENRLKNKGFVARQTTGFLNTEPESPTEMPVFTFAALPSFPSVPIFGFQTADEILNSMIELHRLPLGDSPSFVTTAGGAIRSFAELDHEHAATYPGPGYAARGQFSFLEIDEHGMLVFRNQASQVNGSQLPYLPLVHLIVMMLISLRWFCNRIGYRGFVDVGLSITRSAGLWLDTSRCDTTGLEVGEILDDEIAVDFSVSFYELDSNFEEIACELLAKFAHAAGLRGTTAAFHKSCFENVHAYMALMKTV